ncbi:A-agglutinin anchorage subunit [Drosophila teissieri]|uniref:A-agglutinin anchorage subunit n=1 Tax=Drosophila teissieri TaxID=7243 RepID=UPI001CBA429B|nr:A-agglutinin anchorage subunit [Drosophila teissieri]
MKVFILTVLLGALVAPTIVSAACGTCEDAHSCIGESEFQLCYDGVRDQTINFTCPESKPICTTYGIICMPNDTSIARGCGDVSNCGVCSGDSTFACTSRTTFAVCNSEGVSANNFDCADDYVCSVSSAAGGNPCVSRCDSTDSDICDRILDTEVESTSTSVTPTVTATEPSTATTDSSTGSTGDTSTGSTSVTSSVTSDSSTDSTVTGSDPGSTTASTATTPAFNEVTYCQGINSTGRYPIPSDTVCTSYIYCVPRSGSWAGLVYNCNAQRPYFDADSFTCGTVRPSYAGCTNLA